MASQFGYSSLPNGVHGVLEYYNINSQTFMRIYRLRYLHLNSSIKQLILKHGTKISLSISSQYLHHNKINICFQLLNVLGGDLNYSINLDTYLLIFLFKDISNSVHWRLWKKNHLYQHVISAREYYIWGEYYEDVFCFNPEWKILPSIFCVG